MALFFVLGMGFMAALFVMARPELWHTDQARLVTVTPQVVARQNVFESVETGPAAILPDDNNVVEGAPGLEGPEGERSPTEELALAPSPAPAEELPPDAEEPVPAALPPSPPRAARERQPVFVPVAAVVNWVGHGRQIFARAMLMNEPTAEVKLPLDPACGALKESPKTTRHYRVGEDKALADVVIVIREGLPRRRWLQATQPFVIATRNCAFEPYISAVQVEQPIMVENLDAVLHNAHVTPRERGNRERNVALLPKSKPARFNFQTAEEFIPIKNDVRPWMFAYVTVVEHPFFAVTAADGRGTIRELPPGKYTVTASHRKAGTLTQAVEVTEGSSPVLEFRFVAETQTAKTN